MGKLLGFVLGQPGHMYLIIISWIVGRTVIYLCFMGAWLSSVAFRPLLYKVTRDFTLSTGDVLLIRQFKS